MLPLPIDQAIRKLRYSHPVYLVGGPVRDELLGRPCHDWDLVCKEALSFARRLKRRLGGKLITLDDQYRIYRLILPQTKSLPERSTVDVAELVGGSIQKDLARRDFTVNAMAVETACASGFGPQNRGALIDPFSGWDDLKRKRVRAVSRAAFDDDPLRLLRAFRFVAQLGFSLDPITARWISAATSTIRRVASERVREELLRLLTQPASANVLQLMDKARLLTKIIPELETCRRSAISFYGRGGVLKHNLHAALNLDYILNSLDQPPFARTRKQIDLYVKQVVGGFPRAAWLRLATLLHDVGKPATAQKIKGRLRFFGHEEVGAEISSKITQRLRCSRQETALVQQWVRHHMRPGNLAAGAASDKAIARFFRELGEEGVGMLLVSLADHYDYLSKRQWGKGKDGVEKLTQRCLERYYEQRQKVLPQKVLDGHVLMRALKIKPGPIIGKLLEAVQDAQAEGKVTTKAEGVVFARKFFKKL